MANEDNADNAQPKSKKGLIIAVVVVVNVLLIGGVGMFLMMNSGQQGGSSGSENRSDRQVSNKRSGPSDGPIIEMDGFVVNLTNARERRYLKTKLSVQLFSPDDEPEFNRYLSVIRNEILLQLSAVDMEKVQTIDGKRDLEKMLVQKVNGRLDMDRIANIYFTEFVTQ
jgi:flagellar protein FliL